jgi:hypothetical protein
MAFLLGDEPEHFQKGNAVLWQCFEKGKSCPLA